MLDLRAASIAANRFGFGGRPGELDTIAADLRGWLRRQLSERPTAAAGATPSSVQLAAFLNARKERKTDLDAAKMMRKELQQDFCAAVAKRSLDAANSATPFRERLVQFWANHFTVSIQRPVVAPVAVGFENEAIPWAGIPMPARAAPKAGWPARSAASRRASYPCAQRWARPGRIRWC
jgi:uncharacterized protein (DUF1800 family)